MKESPYIQTEIFVKHLQVDSPVTATDVAEMTWHHFAEMCSSDVVALMKSPDYQGVLVTVMVRTPIIPAEPIEPEEPIVPEG